MSQTGGGEAGDQPARESVGEAPATTGGDPLKGPAAGGGTASGGSGSGGGESGGGIGSGGGASGGGIGGGGGSGSCPRCRNPLAPGQDWCTACGLAATTRIERARGWRIPVAVGLTFVALGAGVVAAAFVSVSDDAQNIDVSTTRRTLTVTATSPPAAATTAPTTPPTATTPTATGATPTTTTPTTPGATTATTPGATTATTPTTNRPEAGALDP